MPDKQAKVKKVLYEKSTKELFAMKNAIFVLLITLFCNTVLAKEQKKKEGAVIEIEDRFITLHYIVWLQVANILIQMGRE